MKLLYTNIDKLYLNGEISDIEIETDGEQLFVTVGPGKYNSSPVEDMELYAVYNGEERDMCSSPYRQRKVHFPFDNGVKTLTLTTADGSIRSISWAGDLYDPTPEAYVTVEGFRHMDKYKITYSCGAIDGYEVGLIAMKTHIWSEDRQMWYESYRAFNRDTSGVWADELDSGEDYWDKCRMELYFGAYRTGVDGYVGIYKHTTAEYIVVDYSSPYAPHDLSYGGITAGGSGEISWSRVYDSNHKNVYYELQRSVDGGDFQRIYRGQDKSCTDTLNSDAVTVVYRVGVMRGTSVNDWCVGEARSVALCNAYVGVGGEIRPGAAVYIGKDGVPMLTCSVFEIN